MEILEITSKNLLYTFNFSTLCYISTLLEKCWKC